MRSSLNDHLETILKMRKQRKNFAEIAAYLTANGLPTTRQNLGNFYRRTIKVAKKMRQELIDLEFIVDQEKDSSKKVEISKESKSQINNDSKMTITGSDDQWKPKVIRPPKKNPDVEKPKNKWDDFTIGPDVLQ